MQLRPITNPVKLSDLDGIQTETTELQTVGRQTPRCPLIAYYH